VAEHGDIEQSESSSALDVRLKIVGDSNDDGVINGKDVTRMLKYIKGYSSETGTSTIEVPPFADVTGDGIVNEADVAKIMEYLANFDYSTGTSTVTLGE